MPFSREEPEPARRAPVFYPRGPESHPNHRQRRPGKAIVTLVAIALVALAGLYVWSHLGKAPATPSYPLALTPQENIHREVERVAERIRAAHLTKDINKFLNCYSSSYPNLGGLESQILQLWKDYDVKEVSYRISDVASLGEREASALLVWNIQVYDHRTHDYTLLRPAYKISLEKAGDGWKIRDSREEA
jgi:hypothetical protein